MPNVPNVPGVPPLSSYSASTIVLLAADAAAVVGALLNGPQWGVFLDGLPVIEPDSFVSWEFRQDFPISDYQVEQGAFASYDKVQLPAEIRVSVSAGGAIENRQAVLNQVDAVMNTVDLYDVLTPEGTYLDYNFTHRDLRRTARNGVGLLIIDLWLTEVRENAQAQFQSTQTPAVAGQVGVGSVQPTDPSAAAQAKVQGAGIGSTGGT